MRRTKVAQIHRETFAQRVEEIAERFPMDRTIEDELRKANALLAP